MPFSVTPMTPRGGFTPGNAPLAIAPPSSTTSHGVMPRSRSTVDRLDGRGAADLLVAPEGQPDVLGGHVPGLEQRLDGLADPGHAALVVERAATPDRRSGGTFVDLAAERVVLPRRLAVDGYDVEVGHQHDRPVGARAGPVEEEAVGPDDGERQSLVEQRELARQLGEQSVERLGVDARRVAVGDGRDADEGLKGPHHARLDGHGHGLTVVPRGLDEGALTSNSCPHHPGAAESSSSAGKPPDTTHEGGHHGPLRNPHRPRAGRPGPPRRLRLQQRRSPPASSSAPQPQPQLVALELSRARVTGGRSPSGPSTRRVVPRPT